MKTLEFQEGIDYTLNESGSSTALVTRRPGLSRMRPKVGAPPPEQPGSVDWASHLMFGGPEEMVRYVELLVAGAGDKAEEKWIRFCLLYREWEIRWRRGLLPKKPTLNQVCFSLGMDFQEFFQAVATGVQQTMRPILSAMASFKSPELVQGALDAGVSSEATPADRLLALRLAGIIEDKSGMNVNITNQQATILNVGDKDRLKAPLLQFSKTVEEVDSEVRKDNSRKEDDNRNPI